MKELKEACHGNEEHQAYLTDMGVKALRLDKFCCVIFFFLLSELLDGVSCLTKCV